MSDEAYAACRLVKWYFGWPTRAGKRYGGQSNLARELEMTPQGVQRWRVVPKKRVDDVVAASTSWVRKSGLEQPPLTPALVRPDLYGQGQDMG